MEREKINLIDVLGIAGSSLILIALGVSSVVGGHMVGLVFGGLGLLLGLSLLQIVRNGVRAPTRWERFRAWMNLRPILIGGLGFALLAAFVMYAPSDIPVPTTEMKIALTVAILVWVTAMGYTMMRSQRRQEADETYKKRIDWQEKD